MEVERDEVPDSLEPTLIRDDGVEVFAPALDAAKLPTRELTREFTAFTDAGRGRTPRLRRDDGVERDSEAGARDLAAAIAAAADEGLVCVEAFEACVVGVAELLLLLLFSLLARLSPLSLVLRAFADPGREVVVDTRVTWAALDADVVLVVTEPNVRLAEVDTEAEEVEVVEVEGAERVVGVLVCIKRLATEIDLRAGLSFLESA